MNFSSADDEHPDVIQRVRKFRAFDEPEKKQMFHPFTEFHAPHKPPVNLGQPGDVFFNNKAFKLYMRNDRHWARWNTTPETRLQHPELSNRFLWIIQTSGQRLVDFVPLSVLKKYKIIDATILLKSIVQSQQKHDFTRKRKSEISLDTRKGKKGRLSNIEPPTELSGLDVSSTMLPISLSAPVRPSISSYSSVTPLQTPVASSSRVHVTPTTLHTPVSPQIEIARELLQRNELLEKENQELRLSLRLSKEMAEDGQVTQQAFSTVRPAGQGESTDRAPPSDNDIKRPQLQSPPPTPSFVNQLSNDFAIQDMDHDEPLLASNEPPSFVVMDEDRNSLCQIKSEPRQTPTITPSSSSSSKPKQEYIDLTFSDDDEPSTKPHPIPKFTRVVSSPSYEEPRLQPSPNKRTATFKQVQDPKTSFTPSRSTSVPRAARPSTNKMHTPMNRSSVTSGTPIESSNGADQRPHSSKPKLATPIKRSHAIATPLERGASSTTTTSPNKCDDDDDDILEITPDQFRAGVEAGKRKAEKAGTIVDSSNAQIATQDKTSLPTVKAEPVVESITDEVPYNLAQNPDITTTPAANTPKKYSVDNLEPRPDKGDTMSDVDDLNFDLAYPEDEPFLSPPPAPVRYGDLKTEDADVGVQNEQLAQGTLDVDMGDAEIDQDELNVKDQNKQDDLSANLGFTFDVIELFFEQKKGTRRCNICSALKLNERKLRFPINDQRAMLRHLEITHQDRIYQFQTLQKMIDEHGLDSEQLRPYLQTDD